jgi:hypothetical protein
VKENKRQAISPEGKPMIRSAKGGGIGKDTNLGKNHKPLRF